MKISINDDDDEEDEREDDDPKEEAEKAPAENAVEKEEIQADEE